MSRGVGGLTTPSLEAALKPKTFQLRGCCMYLLLLTHSCRPGIQHESISPQLEEDRELAQRLPTIPGLSQADLTKETLLAEASPTPRRSQRSRRSRCSNSLTQPEALRREINPPPLPPMSPKPVLRRTPPFARLLCEARALPGRARLLRFRSGLLLEALRALGEGL